MDNPALSYHPVPLGHPSNGGELRPYRRRIKFPSAEGWHAPACRGGLIPTAHIVGNVPPRRKRTNAHRPTPGPAQTKFAWVVICGGGGCRAKRDGGWGNTSNKSRVTSNQNGACAPFLYQFPHCNGCIAHAV